MLDMNNAIKQRIERKIAHLLPGMHRRKSNRIFTAIIVNFVKEMHYYAAKIGDALWIHLSKKKRTPIEATRQVEERVRHAVHKATLLQHHLMQ
ncbi:hypothetical protein KIN20_014668 [Parelaphostrongylus tenuis]|uniref:Uncharacterized protein n=1 Tax=Parelaphostrongylus tenuis TaxID=148309 RepID=A0AAD5QPJ4_PARTN|nr:hypothetical protein KIN20_014668 [Parelaphostrongylus tenuis]